MVYQLIAFSECNQPVHDQLLELAQGFILVQHVVFPLSPVAQIICELKDASHLQLTGYTVVFPDSSFCDQN